MPYAYVHHISRNLGKHLQKIFVEHPAGEPNEGQIETEVKKSLLTCPPSESPVESKNPEKEIPLWSWFKHTNNSRYLTRCSNGWPVHRIQVSKCVVKAGQQPRVGSGKRFGGSGWAALPQELYGEDLVTAMTNRVNFTVNHYHQVNDP